MKIMIDAKAGCFSSSSRRDSYRERGLRVSIKHPHKNNPMKTNPSFRIFKLPGLALLGIVAAFVTQSVCGQMPTPTPVVTFTEYSSTKLTAVYTDGFGVSTPLT